MNIHKCQTDTSPKPMGFKTSKMFERSNLCGECKLIREYENREHEMICQKMESVDTSDVSNKTKT